MMLKPLRQRTGAPSSTAVSLPAPTKGWNARDSLANMDPQYAVVMENWIPETNYVKLRNGYSSHATGVGSGDVPTVMVYNNGTTEHLLACSATAIYNATSAGAVGAALASSLTNGNWQSVNFADLLFFVNGADTPRTYDGSTISTQTITGTSLTATDLIDCTVHKERIFLLEKDTLSFWYLATGAVSGTATEFSLNDIAKKGGILTDLDTWTLDSGSGIDDLIAFVTSEGQVIVYAGTDPASANTWSLVGVFNVGKPLGRRSFMKLGGDLLLTTVEGIVSMSALVSGRAVGDNSFFNFNIAQAWRGYTELYSALAGWEPVFFAEQSLAIFNVPVVASTKYNQVVCNTTTGAWCRFTNMPVRSLTTFNGGLYAGGIDGTVWQILTGTSDNGSNITGTVKQAYSQYGAPGVVKKFQMVRPLISSDNDLPLIVQMDVDYADKPFTGSATVVEATGGAPWDTATWDVSEWANDLLIRGVWRVVRGHGHVGAFKLQSTSQNSEATWSGTDIVFEPGGLI